MCCGKDEYREVVIEVAVNNAERLRNTPANEASYIPVHDANMLGWRAWYADGTMYDSRETNWADLPPEGIQIVMIYEDKQFAPGRHYRRQFAEADWYIADCSVKLGTVIEDESFNKIRDEARTMENW